MQDQLTTNSNATGLRIGIAVSQYHQQITESLQMAAVNAFLQCGGEEKDLMIVPVAGTFELTAVCLALAKSRTEKEGLPFDAIVAIGCVITGETSHDQYIAQSVTHGLTAITVETGIPIAFGILTCQSMEQATARSIHSESSQFNNKGAEAMRAAIETANTLKAMREEGN